MPDSNQHSMADDFKAVRTALAWDVRHDEPHIWSDAERALDSLEEQLEAARSERDEYLGRLDEQVTWRQREEVRAIDAERLCASKEDELRNYEEQLQAEKEESARLHRCLKREQSTGSNQLAEMLRLQEQLEALRRECDEDAVAWEDMRQYNIRLEEQVKELQARLRQIESSAYWDEHAEQHFASLRDPDLTAALEDAEARLKSESNPASRPTIEEQLAHDYQMGTTPDE